MLSEDMLDRSKVVPWTVIEYDVSLPVSCPSLWMLPIALKYSVSPLLSVNGAAELPIVPSHVGLTLAPTCTLRVQLP